MTLEKRVLKLERVPPDDRPDLHALASILRNALSPDALMEVSELLLEGRVAEALEIIRPYLNSSADIDTSRKNENQGTAYCL
jgi:hypothetical protein